MALNHWHYLAPQHLWGLPRTMTHVNVRAAFEADIENTQVTTYIWFLCNGYGGPGHFVQVGIGRHHLGNGPSATGYIPIPTNVMTRLDQGFDHWFEWDPVSTDAGFQDYVRQLPVPLPHFIPTLRRVTEDHQSFENFEALIDREERRRAGIATALPQAAPQAPPQSVLQAPPQVPAPAAPAAMPSTVPAPPAIDDDLENFRREQTEPHSQGYIYLIHMEDTTFYKIGMSLDPQIRLRTLQTGNPHLLRLLHTQAVQDMRSAESDLHQQFETQRVINLSAREWFDFSNGTDNVDTAFGRLQ